MENLERVQARLDNIRSVQPILEALRTISLGSWQAAQKQRASTQSYREHLLAVAAQLQPQLRHRLAGDASRLPQRVAMLVIGSERGLCGRFNRALVEKATQHIRDHTKDGQQVEVYGVGSRLCRYMQHQQSLAWTNPLPKTAAASGQLAFELSQRWIMNYETYNLDAVDIISNAYNGVGRYTPTVTRLIPPTSFWQPDGLPPKSDPFLIIETDPLSLFVGIITQWIALTLYTHLLESTAAEHSTRYQLMEAATQNAKRLIDELTIAVQTARRQAITEEMQTLVAGAGLVGSD